MGEAPPPQKEYILVVLPSRFEYPKEILEDIRRRHPTVEVKTVCQTGSPDVFPAPDEVKVPDSILPHVMMSLSIHSLQTSRRVPQGDHFSYISCSAGTKTGPESEVYSLLLRRH